MDIGPQYKRDDEFKAAARLHQSRYRAEDLAVGFDTYGNRLTDTDGEALRCAFGIECSKVERLEIEWAPEDRENYLGDHTAFDVYLEARRENDRFIGVGVEVKNTERGCAPTGFAGKSNVFAVQFN